jgi:uncharacterized protein with PIN domain
MIACNTAGLNNRSAWRSIEVRNGYFVDQKRVNEHTSVFDLLGSLGIPPCEVGPVKLLANGNPVDPESRVTREGTLVVEAAPPRALESPRFLGDLHLGRLIRFLRVLGFDTAWENSGSEAAVAERGVAEDRVVLSRNLALLKRRTMRRAMLVLSDDPEHQVAEVLHRFRVADKVRMFGRCSRCNGSIVPVAKAEVADRIPPKTARWLDTYYVCGDCDHLFWEGTHVLALRERLKTILSAIGNEDR